MSFRIDVFNFVQWQGPPPSVLVPKVATHHRAGSDGVSQQHLGKWGDSIECTVTSHWASFLAAMEGYRLMALLPGAGAVEVLFGGVNYSQYYGVDYLIDDVQIVDIRSHVLLIGPSYAYSGGCALVTRFTITPQRAF